LAVAILTTISSNLADVEFSRQNVGGGSKQPTNHITDVAACGGKAATLPNPDPSEFAQNGGAPSCRRKLILRRRAGFRSPEHLPVLTQGVDIFLVIQNCLQMPCMLL
jgi:hypothetical protein